MPAKQGPLTAIRNARGAVIYQMELVHVELHKARVVRSADPDYVRRQAAMQLAQWQEQWSRKQQVLSRSNKALARNELREERKRFEDEQKQLADERTTEATSALEELRHTLRNSLGKNHAINWSLLESAAPFPTPEPKKPATPPMPTFRQPPAEPLISDPLFIPEFSWLDKLIASRRARIEAENAAAFSSAHERWVEECASLKKLNERAQEKFEGLLTGAQAEHEEAIRDWEGLKAAYLQQQQAGNEAVERQRAAYLAKSPDALVGYFDMVLSNSPYPECCPKTFNIDYNVENCVLVVDYSLPAPDALPIVTEVKYVASRAELVEKYLPAAQIERLYDDLLYQVTLRTVHELFAADTVDALSILVFNGYVRSIDRGTGLETNACVLSVQVSKGEFSAINLANVDPKVCFKQLKGVGSSKLHSVAAVAPIMRIRRDDGRFVAAHDVAYQLDDSYNLAAMDWEEFEHLIREVFEKEFTVSGGEVKVTRASRDGGVDAVAFDPDPIRGGKIVIQAKRYTNTVGVAAVRDLYGTVMNEGATKGILVTTSDYGPDAYTFAKSKPLTLLNGANLLHLLEKHGHRAKIDLQAARLAAMEQESHGD